MIERPNFTLLSLPLDYKALPGFTVKRWMWRRCFIIYTSVMMQLSLCHNIHLLAGVCMCVRVWVCMFCFPPPSEWQSHPMSSRPCLPHASGQSHPYGNSVMNGRTLMKWRHQGVGRGRKSADGRQRSCPESEGSGKKDRLATVCCQGRNYTFTLAFS